MFEMMYEANFTYDSSMPIYENRPPAFPYTLDYKMAHDCMIPPCPEKSYPGIFFSYHLRLANLPTLKPPPMKGSKHLNPAQTRAKL